MEGQKEEERATIIPTAVHGLPITSDQDKYVALMKIVQWQLQNLNQEHPLPLDWETYKRLKSHITKA